MVLFDMELNNTDLFSIFLIFLIIIGLTMSVNDNESIERLMIGTTIIVNFIAICLNCGIVNIFKNKNKSKNKSKTYPKKKFTRPLNKKYKFIDSPDKDNVYLGAVDWNEDDYVLSSMDNVPYQSLNVKGCDYRRQISGSTRRRSVLNPYIASELKDCENLPWWEQYDY